jgi:3alpha(or 20beta)-hydroxysteroid dehydrogenase
MVRLFAREGAKVMIHGRRKDRAQRLAEEIGVNVSFVVGSLQDPHIPAKLIAETTAQFGRIDGLVNNAALMTRGGMINGAILDVEQYPINDRNPPKEIS